MTPRFPVVAAVVLFAATNAFAVSTNPFGRPVPQPRHDVITQRLAPGTYFVHVVAGNESAKATVLLVR